jgi:hypothetical protein
LTVFGATKAYYEKDVGMIQNISFKDMSVVVVPYTVLGDSTIGLRLAWIFRHAGAQVSFYSSLLWPARKYFPWLNVIPYENLSLQNLSTQFDLVLCDVGWLSRSDDSMRDCLRLDNIAYIGWKRISKNIPDLSNRNTYVKGHLYSGANRSLCLDSRAGLSMVQWMDQYAREVFGLDCPESVPVCKDGGRERE